MHTFKRDALQTLSEAWFRRISVVFYTWTRKWENFFQSGKSRGILDRLEMSGNFKQNIGKIREFYPKYWKMRKRVFIFIFSLIFN